MLAATLTSSGFPCELYAHVSWRIAWSVAVRSECVARETFQSALKSGLSYCIRGYILSTVRGGPERITNVQP